MLRATSAAEWLSLVATVNKSFPELHFSDEMDPMHLADHSDVKFVDAHLPITIHPELVDNESGGFKRFNFEKLCSKMVFEEI
jgi:hypothetical protein